ncbi:FHA domain-containing protein [Planctomicrobium piriforme]|uniref:Inner membrane component of T3SS domain-containing protein n=1 Tax=Planctomicrobium piriforme TaxID=1576369 RepID=A0A1I3GUE9_9PLAN|nr:FHA domain-containing protein [Planctomicrobium piriforme]SFI27043.1 Inner membrane component of T3SS domain-containing protein [Planctomicrobium piriforme]
MAQVTFQVVEGLEAGRIFRHVSTPLTIGREEDNDIQLNDERISRFHVKVQEDAGRIILTDLDSTNGTRVNGHPVRLRVLRPGDLVMLGRSVLLVGGPDELKRLTSRLQAKAAEQPPDEDAESQSYGTSAEPSDLSEAFPSGRPPLPRQLSPLQKAELVDLLDYLRTEVLSAVSSPTDEMHTSQGDFVRVQHIQWLRLESLSPEISRMINELINPDDK